MMIDTIYFNHKGLELAQEDNLADLLYEIADFIDVCKNNDIALCFYKHLFSVNLGFTESNIIDYINREKKYLSFCYFFIEYIANNLKYPVNDSYCENDSDIQQYLTWFLNLCKNNKQNLFLSLTNDNFFYKEQYNVEDFLIDNYKNIEKFKEYCDSIPKFSSIINVVDYINNKYQNKIQFLSTARKSSRQISNDNITCVQICKAFESLINIVLPYENHLPKNIVNKFEQESGFKISKESEKTINNSFCREKRTFNILNEPYVFDNHIKIDDKIRIHYYIKDGNIYIGHCGKHLPTATRRT